MSHRVPSVVASAVGTRAEISIRLASPADSEALAELAQLADRRLPDGPMLLALTDGRVAAAVGTNGVAVTDPFSVTLDLVELLRLRSSQLRAVAA